MALRMSSIDSWSCADTETAAPAQAMPWSPRITAVRCAGKSRIAVVRKWPSTAGSPMFAPPQSASSTSRPFCTCSSFALVQLGRLAIGRLV